MLRDIQVLNEVVSRYCLGLSNLCSPVSISIGSVYYSNLNLPVVLNCVNVFCTNLVFLSEVGWRRSDMTSTS